MTSEGQYAGSQPAEATSGGPSSEGTPPNPETQRAAGRAQAQPPADGFPSSYGPPPHTTPNGGSPFVVPAVSTFGPGPEGAPGSRPAPPAGRSYGSARVPQPDDNSSPSSRPGSPYGSVSPGHAGAATYGPATPASPFGPAADDSRSAWAPQTPPVRPAEPASPFGHRPEAPPLPQRSASVPVDPTGEFDGFAAGSPGRGLVPDAPPRRDEIDPATGLPVSGAHRFPGATLTGPRDTPLPTRTADNGGFPAHPTGHGNLPMRGGDNGGAPGQSADNGGFPMRPTDNGGLPMRSADNGGLPIRSADNGGQPGRSADNGGLPIRSADNGGQPGRSADNGGLPIRSADNGGQPGRSADNGGFPMRPSDNGGLPVRPNDNGGLPVRPTDNGGLPVRSAGNSGGPGDNGGVKPDSASPGRPADGFRAVDSGGFPLRGGGNGSFPTRRGESSGFPLRGGAGGDPEASRSDELPVRSQQAPFGPPPIHPSAGGSAPQPAGPFGSTQQPTGSLGSAQQPAGSSHSAQQPAGSLGSTQQPADGSPPPAIGSFGVATPSPFGAPESPPGSYSPFGQPAVEPHPYRRTADSAEAPFGRLTPGVPSSGMPSPSTPSSGAPSPSGPDADAFGRPSTGAPTGGFPAQPSNRFPTQPSDSVSGQPSGAFPAHPSSPTHRPGEGPGRPFESRLEFPSTPGGDDAHPPYRSTIDPEQSRFSGEAPPPGGGYPQRVPGAALGAISESVAPQPRNTPDSHNAPESHHGPVPQPRDPGHPQPPAVGSARPVTASASVPSASRVPPVEPGELPPPPAVPQARVYGRPAPAGPGNDNPAQARAESDRRAPVSPQSPTSPQPPAFPDRPADDRSADDRPASGGFGPPLFPTPPLSGDFGYPPPADEQNGSGRPAYPGQPGGDPNGVGGFGSPAYPSRSSADPSGPGGEPPVPGAPPARATARASASARVSPPFAPQQQSPGSAPFTEFTTDVAGRGTPSSGRPGGGFPGADQGSRPGGGFPADDHADRLGSGFPMGNPGSRQDGSGFPMGNPGSRQDGSGFPMGNPGSRQDGGFPAADQGSRPGGFASPEHYAEPTSDISGRGPDQSYVSAPPPPGFEPADGGNPRMGGLFPGPASRGTVTPPPGPDETTSWPSPGEQDKFDQFKPEADAAPAKPETPHVRMLPVLLSVVVGAALLVGLAFGIVYLVAGGDDAGTFSVSQGDCVKRSGDAAVKADCDDATSFQVVSIVSDKAKCADLNQPYVLNPTSDGKTQVLCLKPHS